MCYLYSLFFVTYGNTDASTVIFIESNNKRKWKFLVTKFLHKYFFSVIQLQIPQPISLIIFLISLLMVPSYWWFEQLWWNLSIYFVTSLEENSSKLMCHCFWLEILNKKCFLPSLICSLPPRSFIWLFLMNFRKQSGKILTKKMLEHHF